MVALARFGADADKLAIVREENPDRALRQSYGYFRQAFRRGEVLRKEKYPAQRS